MLHHALLTLALLTGTAGAFAAPEPESTAYDLRQVITGEGWRLVQRTAAPVADGSRPGVYLEAQAVAGMAWLEGVEFGDGSIELELRGRNDPQRNFVGVAFHAVDEQTFDAVYFRPFNFQNPDPARRVRAVQYVSEPDYPWHRLRAEHPGRYEQPVPPGVESEDWLKVRIEVQYPTVQVFVDDAAEPSLRVEQLSDRRRGRLGLWIWSETRADFANLKITSR